PPGRRCPSSSASIPAGASGRRTASRLSPRQGSGGTPRRGGRAPAAPGPAGFLRAPGSVRGGANGISSHAPLMLGRKNGQFSRHCKDSGKGGLREPKSEVRMSKSETNPKAQIRNDPNSRQFRVWDLLVFGNCFGFRISRFGFYFFTP